MRIDDDLINRLRAPGAVGRTEADIQSDIKMLLLSAAELKVDAPSLEEQIDDGSRRRIDIAVGSSVIETKKKLTTIDDASAYIAQLQGYVETRMLQTGSRYNGVLSDGKLWWLFEKEPDTGLFPLRSSFNLTTDKKIDDLVAWLQAVLAMPAGITPTPEAIEDTLGSTSPGYAQDKAFLEAMYRGQRTDPTTNLKRELWARLLRSALGTGFEDQEALFLDHTLLSIEAAAIGHAVMGINLADLAQQPTAILTGEYFRDAGIYNVVEADFFDWVRTAPEGEKFLRQVVRRINMFNWSKTEHDVLKVLYESIINAETRKGAGEYYTPDWLAEGVVEKALTRPLEQRALDPSCGSGTFVYHLVKRIIAAAEEAGWDNRKTMNHLQDHVFGLDIHPVSVSLARITYLLALGKRLESDRDDIWVPIHLGDSIQWHQPADHDEQRILIKTDGVDLTLAAAGNATLFDVGQILAFPLSGIDDPGTFDRLVTVMTDLAKTYTDATAKKQSLDSILSRFGITDEGDRTTLQETFNVLCSLNAEGRDSIWGYFVRNQVRPLWLSMKNRRMDVLVGTPSWVAYRFMTEDMQEQFKAFSEARNLWHGARVATQQDLVGLFLARAVEKYLDDGGHFAFVTPLAVLSRSQYEGLRRGDWGHGVFSEFTEVWDLAEVRPKNDLFPVPSAVVFGKKHLQNYGMTNPPRHGFPDSKIVVEGLRNKSGWTETVPALSFAKKKLVTLSTDDTSFASPYRKTVVNGATIFPRMLFFVEEKEAMGKLGQSRGRSNVVSLRSSLEKDPWKRLPDLTGVVEKRYIFPVHLGSTIAPFKLLTPWKAVLPIENGQLIEESALVDRSAPGLSDWWKHAGELWNAWKTKQSKLSLWENMNYQSKLAKQMKGVQTRVVYSKSGTVLAAAVVDDPKIVIDHQLYWIPARSKSEAHYLCAVLNAPITTNLVKEFQSVGLFGGRHFDTYPWRLAIPQFDSSNDLHQELAELSRQCGQIAATVSEGELGFKVVRSRVRKLLDDNGLLEQLDMVVQELLKEQTAKEK